MTVMPHYQMWICPGLCLASRDRGSQLQAVRCSQALQQPEVWKQVLAGR